MTEKYILNPLIGAVFVSLLTAFPSEAQVKRDLTLTNNTSIKIEGNKMIIEGGTQVGQNLFHSFQEFSLSKENIANFNNALDIANIVVRVTGGSASNIDGIISANGTANLFFSNPNGISFGQNARLNIGGSFLATTASAFMFPNGSEFSATNPQAPPLLGINVPVGLRFGSNPGAIQVTGAGDGLTSPGSSLKPSITNPNSSGLSVQNGQNLNLVGNGVSFKGGILTVNGGGINVGSASSGVVSINQTAKGYTLGYEGISDLSDINLSQQSLIAAGQDQGGFITLQGKNIYANDGSVILNQNSGSQSLKDININASERVELSGSSPDGKVTSRFRTETLGTENAGDINIFAKELTLQGGAVINSRVYSSAKGGSVNVDASELVQFIGFLPSDNTITSNITASTTSAALGNAGDISVATKRLLLQNGGLISSLTTGVGNGGDILIKATNSVELINTPDFIASGVFRGPNYTYVSSGTLGNGKAGDITVNTPKLVVGEKASIDTSTRSSGSAGILAINADNIELSGLINSSAIKATLNIQRVFKTPPEPSGSPGEVNINGQSLNIINGGEIGVRNEGIGNGGKLTIKTNWLNLDHKASIAASTASGEGGDISLEARNVQLRHNSLVTATAESGQGNGGNITVKADTVALLEGSKITANAFEGRGGNINIDTQGLFVSPDSKITAPPKAVLRITIFIHAQFSVLKSFVESNSRISHFHPLADN
ncbi:filamentous hemagglutinin N-terminal domain-containing protein [Nostoc sp. CHAB 5836]|uniref:two-partner secretion domain-containing protein n=1 Tax=Nostoc sp. CHAB 5836 TaxID=2780404 RepID=UPI001E2D97BC|nr:filamentous hemagglutinin N-terminal domain-containing protein [Nostoc sp. CHAB 5836]MCC5619335.1 filamentous hemagglutinin N-terminal domain-containing protein [Nostoc sp. CHAB 5836]